MKRTPNIQSGIHIKPLRKRIFENWDLYLLLIIYLNNFTKVVIFRQTAPIFTQKILPNQYFILYLQYRNLNKKSNLTYYEHADGHNYVRCCHFYCVAATKLVAMQVLILGVCTTTFSDGITGSAMSQD